MLTLPLNNCISLYFQWRFGWERDPKGQNKWKKPSRTKNTLFSVLLSRSRQIFHQKCKVIPLVDYIFDIDLENGVSFEFYGSETLVIQQNVKVC